MTFDALLATVRSVTRAVAAEFPDLKTGIWFEVKARRAGQLSPRPGDNEPANQLRYDILSKAVDRLLALLDTGDSQYPGRSNELEAEMKGILDPE